MAGPSWIQYDSYGFNKQKSGVREHLPKSKQYSPQNNYFSEQTQPKLKPHPRAASKVPNLAFLCTCINTVCAYPNLLLPHCLSFLKRSSGGKGGSGNGVIQDILRVQGIPANLPVLSLSLKAAGPTNPMAGPAMLVDTGIQSIPMYFKLGYCSSVGLRPAKNLPLLSKSSIISISFTDDTMVSYRLPLQTAR